MHSNVVTRKVAHTLYLCHLLSTWNARMYEFAAVLFVATAFPENLVASGITMKASVLLFASILGTWVDRASSRLATLITTIMANRISIIGACFCWIFIVGDGNAGSHSTGPVTSTGVESVMQPNGVSHGVKVHLFVVILIFSVVERLSRTTNVLSMERDWLPTLAPPHPEDDEEPSKYGLTELNAVIGRIDLLCKLLSPIVVSAFISAVGSMRIGIIAVAALNAATWTAEIWSARLVWKMNGRLRESKRDVSRDVDAIDSVAEADGPRSHERELAEANGARPALHRLRQIRCVFYAAVRAVRVWLLDYFQNLTIYFSHTVWIPSMALSILHFSVLNYSATLTVHLLNSGFSLNFITIAKALSAITEITSTFFTPWGVHSLSAVWTATRRGRSPDGRGANAALLADAEQDESADDDSGNEGENDDAPFIPETDMGVALLGFLGLAQMEICLLPALCALWSLSSSADPPSMHATAPSVLISAILLTAIPFSRFGRWTNHLATQQLTQTLVPTTQRSAFAGAEMSFMSLFGLAHWVVTAAWNQRAQFRWLALGSVGSVAVSAAAYGTWLRRTAVDERRRR